ncbi:MAG: thiamine biosynthesis lipoprotein [Paraglaciecola sp.]
MKPKVFRFQLLLLILSMLLACSAPQPEEIHLSGPTMGTTYNIKFGPAETVEPADLQREIDALLVDINQLMSTYIADSELSRFNQLRSTEKFSMSSETLYVMTEAARLGELSDGVLDVTIGPLINLWGFGPQSRPETIPSTEEITKAKSITGLDKLKLGDGWARKTEPELYVDLSTIAKGYGVDRVAELLEQHDLRNYLVEIGGEMRVSGNKVSGQAWRIAVEKPVSSERAVQKVISIGDNAIATSGDYRIYYEEQGRRYSHLINPQTGYPITHNLVAVTVVHPSSMTADGLATALIVMGKEKAIRLAEKNKLAVLLISKENGEYIEYTTPQFDQFISAEQ